MAKLLERDRTKYDMIPFMLTVRPEIAAGGIARDDGEIHFYTRVNALLRPEMTVLDYGCGRGALFDSGENLFREQLAKLQGASRRVIGVDVDSAIFKHPFLDEKYMLEKDAPIPVADASVDLVVAHWVFEHIENPSHLARELYRILKPGGWICARTPHRWGYVGLLARLIPKTIHNALLGYVKPSFKEDDKFPTVYRLNSHWALKKYFPEDNWIHCSYGMSSTPRYHFESRVVFAIMSAIHAIPLHKVDLLVLICKKGVT